MKYRHLLVLLMVGTTTTEAADPAEAALTRIEQAVAQAVVELDFETMENIYANDFIFSHSTGAVETKSQWLEVLRTTEQPYTSRIVDDIRVELHDDIAITSGRLTIKRDTDNPRFREFRVRYIRVYVFREQRWQMLSHRSISEETGPFTD